MARRQRQVNQNPKSRLTAAATAFLGGVFGLHKFYLRETGAGILYIMILFFTVNMFSIPISLFLGIMDGMRLLGMSDEKFDQKYNKGVIRYDNSPASRTTRRQVSNTSNPASAPVRRRQPIYRANPFKKSGVKKYKDFDLEGAIADFNKGLEIDPQDVTLYFNLACAYSLTEKKDMAFEHLDKAVQYGLKDFDKILNHDDLAYVRIQKEFEALKANGFRLGFESKSQSNDTIPGKESSEPEVMDDVLLSQLNKLSELRKKGLLSDQEFELEKKKLLRR